ncbi:hypothetical protein [Actinomadura sp. 6K520]|uniref:hypothetical protein n=1 Tax=Actinomadura sp. 6K520 TaxID=2530364 RepID=UPI00104FB1CA|nr:hypothetical protein [Actinomadura sp. 6K520]TDE21348.1 hypothetical protein E1289_31270 [Actinomadura sp. 6K520]
MVANALASPIGGTGPRSAALALVEAVMQELFGALTRESLAPHDTLPGGLMTTRALSATTLKWLSEHALHSSDVAGAGNGVIGIVRGYDKASRSRGTQLRRQCAALGLPTLDIPPVLRHRTTLPDLRRITASVSLLVDVTGHGADARRMAALLARPLLSGGAHVTTKVPFIGIEEDSDLVDVALKTVELRPLHDDVRVRMCLDGRWIDPAPGVRVRISLTQSPTWRLQCTFGEGPTGTSAEGAALTLRPSWGTYVLCRDEEPISDVSDPVQVAPLLKRLTLVPPRRGTALAG